MAESSKMPEVTGLWPILALFLIATGYIQLNPRLDSPRPIGETAPLDVHTPGEGVRARLWQDPLSAITARAKVAPPAQIVKPAPDDRDSLTIQKVLDPLLKDHKGLSEPPGKIPFLILPAFLGGDPYPEDVETRLRLRSAVLSALRAEALAPLDAEHLRYFLFTYKERDLYIPFEWFEPDSLRPNAGIGPQVHVLVLWLNESAIDTGFLSFLDCLRRRLDRVFASHKEFMPEMRVLGPSDSDALRQMVEESADAPKRQAALCGAIHGAANNPKLKIERIYSSQSTAEQARAADPLPGQGGRLGAAPITHLGTIPIDFVIDTDSKLAQSLVYELHLRNSCPARRENDVAIIAEWDTLYGRGIHQVFGEVFRCCKICNPSGAQNGEPTNIHHYTYFRGIDGRLPGDKSTGGAEAGRDKDPAALREPLPGRAGGSVLAVGNARIDYLRRMVDDLMRESPHWKAIGVVGSDVYDKILLIRVLRYYFPGTLLFTTDLDARLLDPAEYPSTHNLLIASHYGLELRQELQRDISPFRSVYETSQFFATLRAIWDARGRAHQVTDNPCDPRTITLYHCESTARWKNDALPRVVVHPAPLVFEVGRTGPFPVGFDWEQKDGRWEQHATQTVHPRYVERSLWPFSPGRDWRAGLWNALLLVLAIVAALVMTILAFPRTLKSLNRIVSVGIVSLVALILIAALNHYDPDGEPLRLLDGISTWPSEFLRLGALFFALGSIVHGWRWLVKNETEEVKPFFDQPSTAELPAGEGGGGRTPWREGWFSLGLGSGPSDWSGYHRLSGGDYRLKRSVKLGLCYALFAVSVSSLLDRPDRPIRGTLNNWTDFLLLSFSVIATGGLLVFVTDATLLCTRFVGRLSGSASTGWSGTKVEECAKAMGFVRPPAAGQVASPDNPRAAGLPADRLEALPHDVQQAIGYLLGVKAIAALTKGVGPLIYYPAVALVLMFLSRNRTLDNWDWPADLVIVFTIAGAAVVACGMALRMAADRSRRHALKGLQTTLHQARQQALGKDDDPLTKAIQATIEEVKAVDEGAYSSISQNPVLRAVLIPLAALAGLIPLLRQLGVNVGL